MSSTTFKRPVRTNAPMQPRNGEKKMELIECITCGGHSITNGKCDYCGNQYEYQDLYDDGNYAKRVYGKTYCDDGIPNYAPLSDYMESLTAEETADVYNNLKDSLTPNQIRTATCKEDSAKEQATFEEDDYLKHKAQELTEQNEKVLKIMLLVLISVIWFAVTVFIPPLFLITIAVLIILAVRKIIKKVKGE